MISVAALLQHLGSYKELLDSCTLLDLERFIRLTIHFNHEIKLLSPTHPNDPPHQLPLYFHSFLVDVLALNDDTITQLWAGLKQLVWSSESHFQMTNDERDRIDVAGKKMTHPTEKLASHMFYPPISICLYCNIALKTTTLSRVEVIVYGSKYGLGARRGYSNSLACIRCQVQYYCNYYTINDSRQFYNSSVPPYIQIDDYAYIEADLCELFTSYMLFGWTSSENCANILNASIKRIFVLKDIDSERPEDIFISSEQVFRAFALNGLLRDCAERSASLALPNLGDNDDRLKSAMEVRNHRIIKEGQVERMHACSKCEKFLPGNGYKNLRSFRAVVIDGIILGRPCCKVQNCMQPLPSNRAYFCAEHALEKNICVVNDCNFQNSDGYQTCDVPAHRELEERRNESFPRLQKHSVLKFFDLMTAPDVQEFDDDMDTAESPDSSNDQPKAQFARRKTHGEQLVVSCCGVILGRGTMFDPETIPGVIVFLKSIYPCPDDLPDVIFYDNNCQLQSHLAAQSDSFFQNIILAVDMFRSKSKQEANEFCNPAKWTELADENGKWIFNSSAAEQVNAWLSGYMTIVRNMLAYRYDFFLDEMIKRRNEFVVDKLFNAGNIPYRVPYFNG